jgi:transcription antitermination factor NusG
MQSNVLYRSLYGNGFHIGVGSDVVCSTIIGNARASVRGIDNRTIPRFFMSIIADLTSDIKNDMNALLNAHTPKGRSKSPHVGLTSNVLPEAQRSQTGVSSDYVQKADHEWFVLRVTYNRTQKACDIISTANVQSYMPMHYIIKKEIGKKKRMLQPLLPNLFFVYATRETVNSIIKKKGEETSVLKFYLDKTKPLEDNGKHPPLTIPFTSMTNFIKATSTDSEHVRIVSAEQCHYKSGDIVKVIDGEFKGVTGRVARIAGQQRVVVEISGLCLVATAYIPNGFLETVQNQL